MRKGLVALLVLFIMVFDLALPALGVEDAADAAKTAAAAENAEEKKEPTVEEIYATSTIVEIFKVAKDAQEALVKNQEEVAVLSGTVKTNIESKIKIYAKYKTQTKVLNTLNAHLVTIKDYQTKLDEIKLKVKDAPFNTLQLEKDYLDRLNKAKKAQEDIAALEKAGKKDQITEELKEAAKPVEKVSYRQYLYNQIKMYLEVDGSLKTIKEELSKIK